MKKTKRVVVVSKTASAKKKCSSQSQRPMRGQPRPHAKCCGTLKFRPYCSSCGKKLVLITNKAVHTPPASTTTVTPKLDLNRDVVNKAKKVYAKAHGLPTKDLETIHFSKTLEYACEQHLPTILNLLSQAGLARIPNIERDRPRRISKPLWEKLDDHCSDYDTSRIKLVRAVLNLLATS